MTELEALEKMAWWMYRPDERPKTILVSPETIWRMAHGFVHLNSDYHHFAYAMKRAIETRS